MNFTPLPPNLPPKVARRYAALKQPLSTPVQGPKQACPGQNQCPRKLFSARTRNTLAVYSPITASLRCQFVRLISSHEIVR